MTKLIFVCLGNICRSPIAEGIAKILDTNQKYEIYSAGTSWEHNGEHPCNGSISVAKRNGVDISSHHSTQVSQLDIHPNDLIIALDKYNKQDLMALGYKDVRLLGVFGHNGADIKDPYYFTSTQQFDEEYAIIHKCVSTLIQYNF